MAANKGKQAEIALRIASAKLIEPKVPEANVSMVILHAFAQKFRAVLRFEQVRCTVGIRSVMFTLTLLVMLQPRGGVVNATSVRPPVEFHLQHTQIEA